ARAPPGAAVGAGLIVQDRLASLGAVAAGIAHELRNPLNFVSNFAELSIRQLGDARRQAGADGGDAAALERTLGTLSANLERIRDHGRRMDSTVRSILEHSRPGKPSAIRTSRPSS